MALLGKMITVFLTSVFLLKVAVLSAIAMQLNFYETLLSAGLSGITSSFVFTYVFDGAIKWLMKFLERKFPEKTRKRNKFTWKNRFIVRSKKNFGMLGIAIIAPVLISIPVGAFLGVRFFGDKKKVFLYLSASAVTWTIVLYSVFGGWFLVRH
jgi:hypothetical protein